jgi:hypothetical protein
VRVFLGVQIAVFELARAMARLREQSIVELRDSDAVAIETAPGQPRHCTALDPAGLALEITDFIVPAAPKTKAGKEAAAASATAQAAATAATAASSAAGAARRVQGTLEANASGAYTGSANDPSVAARLMADAFFDHADEWDAEHAGGFADS